MIDVLVIGAGPAGLVAATLLARRGRRVALLDQINHQRHKIGESVPGVMNSLLTQLELEPIDSNKHKPINGSVTLWANDRRTQDAMTDPQGGGWRLDRHAFEAQLHRQACDSGVQMISGLLRQCFRTNGAFWSVDIGGDDTLEADFVIDATGRRALVAQSQNIERVNNAPLLAVWAVGQQAHPDNVTNRTLIESAPDGWWYGAFLPDGRSVCAFHTDQQLGTKLKRDPKQWLARLSQTTRLSENLVAADFVETNLSANDARSSYLVKPYGEHWAACGDAALSFDPLSSQGIFNAIATANMLVKALSGGDLPSYSEKLTRVFSSYQKRRDSLYLEAESFYQTSFWLQQRLPIEMAGHP